MNDTNICDYIGVDEVKQMLCIGRTMAYDIIRQINADLKERGYIVIAGRIPRHELLKKLPYRIA